MGIETKQKKAVRRHSIYIRVLLLIDSLAPVRRGLTVEELWEQINIRSGEGYSRRTIRRDLDAMYEIGLVSKYGVPSTNGLNITFFWTLNLRRTESVQSMAYNLLSESLTRNN